MADGSAQTPWPNEDTLSAVRSKVVKMGGDAERRRHTGRYTRFKTEDGDRLVERCSCGHDALVSLPYRDQKERLKKFVVCLICDAATRFPRLAT
jgi:RNase P subunit RPR2